MKAGKTPKLSYPKPNINRIINSRAFGQVLSIAGRFGTRPVRALMAVSRAAARSVDLKDKGKMGELKRNLKDLGRMLKAYFSRQYRDVPYATILKCLTAVVYFLFVADFIPDFIPGLGLLDDAAVLAWVANSVQDELHKFNAWEKRQLAEAEINV